MIRHTKYARVIEERWDFNLTDLTNALVAHVRASELAGLPGGVYTVIVHDEDYTDSMGRICQVSLVQKHETTVHGPE